jgi:hypothetical protein
MTLHGTALDDVKIDRIIDGWLAIQAITQFKTTIQLILKNWHYS